MAENRIYEFDFEENPHLYLGSPYYEIDEAEPDSVTDEIDALIDAEIADADTADRPFDFLDRIPSWTYIPACGHKVYYRNRLDEWGYCRECKDYFQVDKQTVEIAPRRGELRMREDALAAAVDNGIMRNRIARILWASGYRDEGTGIGKALASEVAKEVGHPEKSRMVTEVAHHGIVRVTPGRLDPVLGGRRTHLQADKAADRRKKTGVTIR